jgi:hypothetical protein
MQRFSRLGQYFGLSVAILPACLIVVLITKYSVDVPYWDQWNLTLFFEKLSRGTLSLADLFAQQNEYRQFFPNLIFVALGWLTRWDVRYEMFVSFLLACLVSFNIYRLSKITIGGSQLQRFLLLFMSNLLIFSPIQYENWLAGEQVVYYMPIACVTTCILIAYSDLSLRAKFLICVCLSTVSTFSSANGMLCWIIIPPVLAWARTRGESRGKKRWVFGWIVCAALNATLYLHGYVKPLGHPSLMEPLLHPLNALIYFLAFLGSLFAIGGRPFIVALIVGGALTAASGLLCLYIRRFSADFTLVSRSIGWLMIALYSVLTAVIVTFGRLGFGVGQSRSLRYTTFSLYLAVALVNLVPIILDDATRRGYLRNVKAYTSQLIPLMAALLMLVQALVLFVVIRHGMSVMLRQRLHAKACLLFINAAPDECAKGLLPDIDVLKQDANVLNRLGYLRPALIESQRVQDIEASVEAGDNYGSFNVLMRIDDGVYAASGWAVLPPSGRPADAILLAYDNGGDDIVFALADVSGERNTEGRDAPVGAQWQKTFSTGTLPTVPTKLRAWAFDAVTGKAYQLNGTHVVQ